MYVNYLAPIADLKKPAVWAATPREAGSITRCLPQCESCVDQTMIFNLLLISVHMYIRLINMIIRLYLLPIYWSGHKTCCVTSSCWRGPSPENDCYGDPSYWCDAWCLQQNALVTSGGWFLCHVFFCICGPHFWSTGEARLFRNHLLSFQVWPIAIFWGKSKCVDGDGRNWK